MRIKKNFGDLLIRGTFEHKIFGGSCALARGTLVEAAVGEVTHALNLLLNHIVIPIKFKFNWL